MNKYIEKILEDARLTINHLAGDISVQVHRN